MSSANINQYDIIIAGAGPVGLSLALALGRAGASVLLLEKKTKLDEHSRAPAIWPRTMEVFADLSVADEFLAAGLILETMQMTDAKNNQELLRLPLSELKTLTAFPHLLILPQQRTELILLNALKDVSQVSVKFSAEITTFSQTSEEVTVTFSDQGREQQAQAKFLVGCDGAKSTVREKLGFSLAGMTYSIHAALADVRFKQNKDLAFPRLSFGEPLCIAIKIQADLWRLILPYAQNSKLTLDERISQSVKRTFNETEYEEVWKSEFRLHRRFSTELLKGRIVLAGDAAHLNSPVGGQGMNSGIQDAEILNRALIKALAENSPAPLEYYCNQRSKSIKQGVNTFTDKLTKVLLAKEGKYLRFVLKTANLVLKFKPARLALLKRLAMLTN